jgi:hypothetical protein
MTSPFGRSSRSASPTRGESDEDLVAVTERAEAAAAAWLNERSLAFRLLTSQAEDLSKAPKSKRQRRSQREA